MQSPEEKPLTSEGWKCEMGEVAGGQAYPCLYSQAQEQDMSPDDVQAECIDSEKTWSVLLRLEGVSTQCCVDPAVSSSPLRIRAHCQKPAYALQSVIHELAASLQGRP